MLQKTFGLDPLWGVIISSVVVTAYCMMGGFIAVVVTDVFQAILMIFTLVVFPVIALFVSASHDLSLWQSLQEAGGVYLSATQGKTGITAFLFVLSGLSWALGYTGQPQLLTRMMAIRNDHDVKRAKWVASVWTILAYIGAILIGLYGIAFVQSGILDNGQGILSQDAEKILPAMVLAFVNPILAGILLSGVISAMMSTAATELTVSASSMGEDMVGTLRRKVLTDRNRRFLNQFLTLAVGVVAILLALTMTDTVYGLVSYAWSGIGSSFGPALLLILFWKRVSRAGVIASLLSGTISTIIWKNLFEEHTGVSERLTSFVFAFGMAVLFSLLFPEKKKD